MKIIRSLLIIVLFSGALFAQRNTVLVRPKPIDDVLLNPNMGITTFNRFNGQATNPPLKWSELGPVRNCRRPPRSPTFPIPRSPICAGTGLHWSPSGENIDGTSSTSRSRKLGRTGKRSR